MFLTIEAPFHAISDDAMKEKYIAAVNKLFADRESIIADYEEILSSPIYNTDELEKQKEELEAEMNAAADQAQKEIQMALSARR